MANSDFFPHENIRDSQHAFMNIITENLEKKKSILIHAPTGIGKTAAVIAPVLEFALKNKLDVFFLTSRHSQHLIAVETLKKIKNKGHDFKAADIIGKKWICLQDVEKLNSSEFADYCKSLRENNHCSFYENTKDNGSLSVNAKLALEKIDKPMHIEEISEICKELKVCPYEILINLSKEANFIITDYFYIFDDMIRTNFFRKTDKELSKSIIIVDEAHNLGERVRDLMSSKISTFSLQKASDEASKFGYQKLAVSLAKINQILKELSDANEKKISKYDFKDRMSFYDYNELIKDLNKAADDVREKQKNSFMGSIARFLYLWNGEDEGFTRIIVKGTYKGRPTITLSYICLDPSLATQHVIEDSYSTVIMSGTLTPTSMYREILGFPDDAVEAEFKSPFPKENRMNIIVPETTTKYSSRSEKQYEDIAEKCNQISKIIPGNIALFFPSYDMMEKIERYLDLGRSIFMEEKGMKKHEKTKFLEKFKKTLNGAMLAVVGGSFSEGIDLPGILKCVVVIGLPLQPPDLETKEMITYYDHKFGKGWDYGYIFPAMNKVMQAAGRCIRNEKDRAVRIFLDERYTNSQYLRFFPKDWDIQVLKNWEEEIINFFSES
jgi:DNA excision repair protein ERCC-2